jgi:hypothetical protein
LTRVNRASTGFAKRRPLAPSLNVTGIRRVEPDSEVRYRKRPFGNESPEFARNARRSLREASARPALPLKLHEKLLKMPFMSCTITCLANLPTISTHSNSGRVWLQHLLSLLSAIFSIYCRSVMSSSPSRVSFASLTPNNLGTVRKLNSVLFPIKYSEKFYQTILLPEAEEFCKLGEAWPLYSMTCTHVIRSLLQ